MQGSRLRENGVAQGSGGDGEKEKNAGRIAPAGLHSFGCGNPHSGGRAT